MTSAQTLFIEAAREEWASLDFNPDDGGSSAIPGGDALWISGEYPVERSNFPGIWVEYTPSGELAMAGIGHTEYSDAGSTSGQRRKAVRWMFSGEVTFTAIAFTSLERARLIDAIVATFAAGIENPNLSAFRSRIEHNDLIGMTAQWSILTIGGFSETPGTPWGSDEIVWEGTVTLAVTGEFVWAAGLRALVPLTSFVVYDRNADDSTATSPPAGDEWL